MASEPAGPLVSGRKLALAGVVMVAIAIAVAFSGITARRADAARLQQRAEAQAVRTVAVIAPGNPAQAAGALDLPGRIEAHARAPIYSRVSGYLKSWKADIGTPVKAGQLLAEIDTPDLDQQLLQAQAELASARSNAALAATTAKRWQALRAVDFVSGQAVEEKAGDLAVKQGAVNALQANVDRIVALKGFARIVAPFDGIVTARSTDIGALINTTSAAGAELFVVSDMRKLRLYVNLPQSYVAVVRQGTKARFSVPENPGKLHTATVQSLSQAIASGSGTMLIQLAADNPGAQLLPGGFANVSFALPAGNGALNIPPSALIFGKAGLRVATVDADSKVVLKPVTIARDFGSVIELASGLSASDRVIESPPDGVAEGDLVRVAERAVKEPPWNPKK